MEENNMSPIEITATVFGLLCVWYTIKENIWCWPTGLIQVILYVYVFYTAKLYSDSILQIIYIPMSIYGWYYWLKGGKNKTEAPVTLGVVWNIALWASIGTTGTILWGEFMKHNTDAACPHADAFIVVFSLIAQWLMSKKRLESWVLWFAVDILAIGVYWYKDLYFTAGLYAVYLALAIMGFMAWRKSYKTRRVS
jgi:nicotinamide mononucleotide transporter